MKRLHPKRFLNRAKRSLYDFYWYYLLPDKLYLCIKFDKDFGRKLNLRNPVLFNEKLQWLKLYDRNPKYKYFVDKICVKRILKDVIGESHIIPIIGGPWKSSKEIDWAALPERFVLKCNHDSGSAVVCPSKSNFDIKKASEQLDRCVSKDFYHRSDKQWAYKGIDRYIFAEQYIVDEETGDLPDFKFHCCGGKVKCVLVCMGRHIHPDHEACMSYYDLDWKRLPYGAGGLSIPWEVPKPEKLDEMIELAEKISKYVGNPYTRIDFYYVSGVVYFGEVTFYPGGGQEILSPKGWDEILGSWIELPRRKTIW